MRRIKDPSVLRETNSALKQRQTPHTVLKDYSLRHNVSMGWDLNKESKLHRMFVLRIDDVEVILDWEEILKAGRFI